MWYFFLIYYNDKCEGDWWRDQLRIGVRERGVSMFCSSVACSVSVVQPGLKLDAKYPLPEMVLLCVPRVGGSLDVC